jgi:outer membrane protein OmpA-like peptidoglycan-associated protein
MIKEPDMIASTSPFRARISLALAALAIGLGGACATAVPPELLTAREAYQRASQGPAAQLTPVDLHKAQVALEVAEQSFAQRNDPGTTADLSYVAQVTAQIAEARAATAIAAGKRSTAEQELGRQQGVIAKATLTSLVATREKLRESEHGKALETQQVGVERAAREAADQNAAASERKAAAADQKTAEANDALAKLAAKEDARGLVITLSGSVLFRSNDATLMPGAQSRLDQVADALVAKGQAVVIEGYTDSRGSQSTNLDLSQRRAEAVRVYLVSRGFPSEKISARGMGPDHPIADNSSVEGRANNRRVEIVIGKAVAQVN